MHLRVLELYSGIGGFHWALKIASPNKFDYEVVASIEINSVVLEIYQHNFTTANALNRNIEGLTSDEINKMKIDMIVMSPPCQPFSRNGLQRDVEDQRTNSFCHLLEILPEIQFKYLILENVKGFETSQARNALLHTLSKCQFQWQEYLVNPLDLGIPNSRLRYYLIAKSRELNWFFQPTGTVETTIPMFTRYFNLSTLSSTEKIPYEHVLQSQIEIWKSRRQKLMVKNEHPEHVQKISKDYSWCVADILEDICNDNFQVPENVQEKYEIAMDLVELISTSTCCFTKSYGHYVKGTGSILQLQQKKTTENSTTTTDLDESKSKSNLRFFTPREVARLMCYPDSLEFPSSVTLKQQYKALGNSLNPYVVAILISLLISESDS